MQRVTGFPVLTSFLITFDPETGLFLQRPENVLEFIEGSQIKSTLESVTFNSKQKFCLGLHYFRKINGQVILITTVTEGSMSFPVLLE